MLRGCTSLKEIVIPKDVASIGNNAFTDSGLIKITYEGTKVYVSNEYKYDSFAGHSFELIEKIDPNIDSTTDDNADSTTENNDPNENLNNGGIEPGAIAGISIGAIIVVSAIVFCVFWFVIRKPSNIDNEQSNQEAESEQAQEPELKP